MLEVGKPWGWLAFVIILVFCMLSGCASQTIGLPAGSSESEPETPRAVSPVETLGSMASDSTREIIPALPAGTSPAAEADSVYEEPGDSAAVVAGAPGIPDRVDVVYFHRAKRCVTCLCFEDHISSVVDTYFTDAIDDNRLTYRVVNLGDKANRELAMEYGATGSQLFVNSVIDGQSNIENIMEIWNWNCRGDGEGFDTEIIDIILSRLNGEK